MILKGSFANNLTCYHAHYHIVWQVDDLDDFQKKKKKKNLKDFEKQNCLHVR